jgi:hypothetical protein
VSLKQKFRNLLTVCAIALALFLGAPMRPDQIEDLLRQINQPKIAHVLRQEAGHPDGPEEPLQ